MYGGQSNSVGECHLEKHLCILGAGTAFCIGQISHKSVQRELQWREHRFFYPDSWDELKWKDDFVQHFRSAARRKMMKHPTFIAITVSTAMQKIGKETKGRLTGGKTWLAFRQVYYDFLTLKS